MNIITARTQDQIDQVRLLFREYEHFLNVDLCFQGFEAELASLPGRYGPPTGVLLMAVNSHDAAGCVALRRIGEGICEMKRLYLRPGYRGTGLGRKLADTVINHAITLGYTLMRLDTLDTLKQAMGLYESLGFKQTGPYYNNPLPGVVYWELPLTGKI